MSRRSAAFDVLLTAAVFAYGQAEVWNATGGGAANLVGPLWANSGAYGIASLLLLARRRHPLAVVVGQCLVLTVELLAFGSSESGGAMLPVLVGLYSVAAYGSRREAILGAAAAGGWIVVHALRDPLMAQPGDLVGGLAFAALLPLTWLLGDYARTRRLYLAELAERGRRADREQQERARQAVLHERARIAREVHDVVANGLAIMVRQAEAGEIRFDSDPERARTSFPAIAETGRQALTEVRRLVALLRTDDDAALPADQPMLDVLDALIAQLRDAGLDVRLSHEQLADVPAGVQLTACRVVQEALANTLSHANARHAEVSLRRDGEALVTEVTDDGTPTSEAARRSGPGGHGLTGMGERVAVHDGQLLAGPRAEGGFRVRARLPFRVSGP